MAARETCACSVEEAAVVNAAIEAFEPVRTNLIPILHKIQDETGRLTGWALEKVADALGVPLSDVWGTATFYTMFDLKGAARHIIRLCDSPPCHITGAPKLREAIYEELGIEPGEVTEDGLFGLEEVSCFGVCGVAPAIIVDHEVYGNLTPEMIPGIIAKYREG